MIVIKRQVYYVNPFCSLQITNTTCMCTAGVHGGQMYVRDCTKQWNIYLETDRV